MAVWQLEYVDTHGIDELEKCIWTWIETDLDEYDIILWIEAAASNKQKRTMDGSSLAADR